MGRPKNPEPPYPRECAMWELLRCPRGCTCLLCQLNGREPAGNHVLADAERYDEPPRSRQGRRPSG